MHAFVTVWPSVAEFRMEDGKGGSEPLTENRTLALGRMFALLIDSKVESIEIRVENSDD